MGVRSEGNGKSNNWKILIGLSVLCAVLVFLGGFLHRRALDSAIADRQAKSVAFVNTKVATAAKHADLSSPMKDAESATFTKQIDLPAGTDLRLFSNAGVPLYSSPGLASFSADTEGIQTAAAGDQGRVVDGADLRIYAPVDGTGAKPVAIAAVISNYTQLRHEASGPLDAVRLPLIGLGIVLLVAGLLLMLQATKGSTAAKAPPKEKATSGGKVAESKASSSKVRVTGFDPVPVTTGRSMDPPQEEPAEEESEPVRASEPVADAEPAEPAKTVFGLRLPAKRAKKSDAPSEVAVAPAAPKAKRSLFAKKDATPDPVDVMPKDDKAASALDREVAIRQALEDQLEQLRTRIQMQDVETNNATKELLAQLEAANRRAEEAEARATEVGAPAAPAAPASAPADDAALRVQQLERELAEGRSVTADAIARAETLQRQLDEAQAAPAAPATDANAEAKVAEAMAQLADAQQRATGAEQRASAAEQRAASVESVRDELEVRVAQLGTKASDLEQRATELETSLHEANAGGDAVRAEIATLTAALAAANARVTELESAPPVAPSHSEEDQAEIARLRSELANHMERGQSAEERATKLEADLLAAQRGVSDLPVDTSSTGDVSQPDPVPAVVDEVSLASRFAPDEPEISASAAFSVAEPEVHEPEVHEPEVHEPKVQEPEEHDVPASFMSATSASEVAEGADVAEPQQASVNPWGSSAPALRREQPEEATVGTKNEPDRDTGELVEALEETQSVHAEAHAPAVEPEVHESDVAVTEASEPGSVVAQVEEPQVDEPEHVETELEEPQVDEPQPVETEERQPERAWDAVPSAAPETETPERSQPEINAPAPVAAQVQAAEPVEAEPVTADWREPTPAVEWHAPSSTPTPVASSPASNGNGIPPAPSDDARYDDIWSAAFAPPEPEQAQENGDQSSANGEASHVEADAEEPSPVASAPESVSEPEPELHAQDVSPNDQPSPPEDRMSAEDDMWSLRARLADAAARKKMPHQSD